jgi:TPR repeat protein
VDRAAAARWIRRAADLGDPSSLNNLGVRYEHGWGVAQDYAAAMTWYRRAAAKGLPIAWDNIGRLYWAGQGVPADPVEAVKWFQRGADTGLVQAQINLAAAYAAGKGAPADPAKALFWYDLALARTTGPTDAPLHAAVQKVRDLLANTQPPTTVAEADRLAKTWRPAPPAPPVLAATTTKSGSASR